MPVARNIKRVFASGALRYLTVGGTLAAALWWAIGQDVDPPACGDIVQAFRAQPPKRFLLGFEASYSPPQVVDVTEGDDRVLGACDATTCVIDIDNCGHVYEYSYRLSSAYGSGPTFKLAVVNAVPKIWGSWRKLAQETPNTTLKMFETVGAFATACPAAAELTVGNCRDMWNDIEGCWLRTDGQYCNRGLLYGPGEGGITVCVIGGTDVPVFCDDNARGPTWYDSQATEATPTDAELDL